MNKIAALTLVLFLAGCSVNPVAMNNQEIINRVKNDKTSIFKEQPPVNGPINIYQAAARALKYNLDYKLKLMEDALYLNVFEISRYDMLPQLLVAAGYTERNNDFGGKSSSLLTGAQSLEPSTSQQRQHVYSNASFSWNILDFGISYIRAKQKADQFLISTERRRKVIQNVLLDVRSAYYRALGAQKLEKKAEELLTLVKFAMDNAGLIETRKLLPAGDTLNYQRALIDTTNLLIQKKRELQLAKIELAALMNLQPGTKFELADVEPPKLNVMPQEVELFEEIALIMRPELREEDYKTRISAEEAKRLKVSFLPSISFDAGYHYDSNKYLYNSDWFDYGANLSINLMRLFSLPAALEMNKNQQKVDEVRRQALSIAVVTQVQIALQRYEMAMQDYNLAEKGHEIDQKLFVNAQQASKGGFETELEMIKLKTKALLSEIQKFTSYANAQAAYARIFNSIGMDILPAEKELKDIDSAAEHMKKSFNEWDRQIAEINEKKKPVYEGSK